MIRKVVLFDFDFIAARHVDDVVDHVMSTRRAPSEKLPLLITPNVDQIVKLHRDPYHTLAQSLRSARWILPDGQPIVTLSRWIYGKLGLPARLAGSDLFPSLWTAIKQSGSSAFFVVPSDEIGKKLCAAYGRARYYAPPFFNLQDAQTAVAITEGICKEADGVDFLFIGLGFPKQETLALAVLNNWDASGHPLPVTCLLGASFEFYAGFKKRAPKWMQKLGLEFVHRLLSEPRRMARRYLVDDTAFLGMAIREYRYRKAKRANRL